jgi:shikimate dehydrogenase
VSAKACVVGWPVAHSRSPLIHGLWLKRHGIAGEYGRCLVPPEEAAAFFAGFARSGLVGANVTLPHKETAFEAAQERTDVAARLGAVNTLWFDGGRLHGDNTDVYGFLANLDERALGWDAGGEALVLGAGGAARAIVFALVARGFAPVQVLNRTLGRAQALAAHFGAPVRAGPLAELAERLKAATIVVNTTSAGLHESGALDLDWRAAREDAIAADIVYVPLMTPFLAGAAARNLRVVDGLGMLLHQAVPGFERWFGVRPVVDEALRQAVLADLTA